MCTNCVSPCLTEHVTRAQRNIRVFYRARPLLLEDECDGESSVLLYPTSTNLVGWGIDMIHVKLSKHIYGPTHNSQERAHNFTRKLKNETVKKWFATVKDFINKKKLDN